MPKVSRARLFSLSQEFKQDSVETDGTVIRCSICDSGILLDEKHQRDRIKQHISTSKHQKNKTLQANKSRQPLLRNAIEQCSSKTQNLKKFNIDLCAALTQAGIPLNKVNHPTFKGFLEKYTKMSVPDESTIRRNYMEPVYQETIKTIKEKVTDCDVGIILDETTDSMERYVLNILVFPLSGENVKPMLFKMYELEKANASTVMQSIMDFCQNLWPSGIAFEKLLLVVTDQAPYMVSAIKQLKPLFPKLKHVTCLVHALHRVCESIRNEYDIANEYISALKKILQKAPSRVVAYKEITGLPLPKFPVITRWGSWIQCAVMLCENFDKIKDFVLSLDPADAGAISKAQQLLLPEKIQNLETELFCVHGYKYLTAAIKQLEEQGLEKEKQWDIFTSVRDQLEGFAKDKLESSLQKNPDVEEFATCVELPFRVNTKFAPLVSVDVERSFSMYKDILCPNRNRLIFKNVEMLNVLKYNSFLYFTVSGE